MSSIPNYTTPPWPSLYNPGLEILHIEYSPPTQPGGKYLYYADGEHHVYHYSMNKGFTISTDIFRFTLYWTLMFYLPPFLICGFYAFWNYAFPPSKRPFDTPDTRTSSIRLSKLDTTRQSTTRSKTNKGRSRVTFAVVVFLIFISLSLAGAVIGSAILGFTTFGLYKSADFNMSTYVELFSSSW